MIHKSSTTLERSVKLFYLRALTGLTVHQPPLPWRSELINAHFEALDAKT